MGWQACPSKGVGGMDAAVKPTGVKRTALNDQPWMIGPDFQAQQDAKLESIHGVPFLDKPATP